MMLFLFVSQGGIKIKSFLILVTIALKKDPYL